MRTRLLLAAALLAPLAVVMPAHAATNTLPPDPARNAPRLAPVDPSCGQAPDGPACEQEQIVDLDEARVATGLPPYEVPASFFSMPQEQQLFVLTNLDRVDLGLAPMAALDVQLNTAAQAGGAANQDPALPNTVDGGNTEPGGGSNWAAGFPDALSAYFFWVYADGPGGGNVDCTTAGASGCWIHRHVTLMPFPPTQVTTLLMGASADAQHDKYADIFVAVQQVNTPNYELTWQAAQTSGVETRPAPIVASVTPANPSPGATVTVNGFNLAEGSVSFGGTQVTSTCTATSCTAQAPNLLTPTDVTVSTPVGTSVAWAGDLAGPGGTNLRIAGPDRVATSILASQAAFPKNGSAHAVLIASDTTFADALAAVPLAVRDDGPILLTGPYSLDPRVLPEIQRVLAPGDPITVLGGPLALPDQEVQSLATTGHPVTRVFGPTRFATAVVIAGLLSDPTTVVVVDGMNPIDSATAGPAAVEQGAAILLTKGSLPAQETTAYLAAHTGDDRIDIGAAAAQADPGAPVQLVGVDRYETAAMVAKMFFTEAINVGIAATPADELTGGVNLALLGGPMLLVAKNDIPQSIQAYLNSDSLRKGLIAIGGTYVLSDQVVTDASAS